MVCPGGPPWERFSKITDYRKILPTKPDQSHPNYVFLIGNNILVTPCLQKDAICLTKPNLPIDIGGAYIHDGVGVWHPLFFQKWTGMS